MEMNSVAHPPSAEQLINEIRELDLLEAGFLDEVMVMQSGVGNLADGESLTQWMRNRGWLTEFQADQLLSGKGQRLVLGVYRLLEPLGEGGMGHVFKARHQRLDRTVALKFIRPELIGGVKIDIVRRFQREARAAAQLMHPNVVTLYDADEIEGLHFIAMEYVDGTDLTRLVRQAGPLAVAQACDYARQAALGLQHAHECGLVHRDIKPSNLLLSRRPNADSGVLTPTPGQRAPANSFGQIKILDMGLARLTRTVGDDFSSISVITQQGILLGTPDFIAPEQARNPHGVDVRADLYSLGCTLYYLLTGGPPFPQGTAVEKLLKHQLDTPRPVEELRPGTPPVVAEVVRRLMARRVEDRFQTPVEVAAALEEILRSPEIQSTTGRVLSLEDFFRPSAQTHVASRPTVEPAARTSAGPVVYAPGARGSAATAIDPPVVMVQARRVAVLQKHAGCLMALAFSDDGRRLATAGIDQTVRLWDLAGGLIQEERTLTGIIGEIHALSFSPSGTTLFAGSCTPQGVVWRWDWAGGSPARAGGQGDPAGVEALAFSPDGRKLAIAGGQSVWLGNLEDRGLAKRTLLKGHPQDLKAVAFGPDSKRLAYAGSDGVIDLWESGRFWWRQRNVLAGHHGAVTALAYSPDGSMLVSGGLDQTVRVWDPTGEDARERQLLTGMHRSVRVIRFLDGGKRLVAADDAGHAALWDVASWTKLREWVVDKTLILRLALSADGTHLATGGSDGTVIVFTLEMP
jgi:serine/threonine-protein kinase